MASAAPVESRVRVDGKFFRVGEQKFFVKGVAYGPFPPNAQREAFPSPEQARRDVAQLRELGANVLRIYHPPPRWLLDLAAEHGLRLLVDVPWQKHRCFLDSPRLRGEALSSVENAVRACLGHPAVFAYSVVNEIPADLVRWSGAAAIENFINELIAAAKAVDPECLCTFGNFPPTEFLNPAGVDFVSFNVYLHERRPFENYLARLQMAAGYRPLVLGEFGIDAQREGAARQGEILAWQIPSACRAGLAGTVVFSYTDEWFAGGQPVHAWSFGLTGRDRQPRPAFHAVQQAYRTAPYVPLPRSPRVSVVVASYQGARTLKTCLDSLQRLNYPDYEVILVDDGSTDATEELVRSHRAVRYIRQAHQGLSVARNTGILAATGEIVAFTDADCRADEDWLYYLVGDLLESGFAGMGGHNFLPPDDSPVAAAVMASPGGPAHVMVTDREAEHIPGCNMAFYKWALEEAGGFDPIFHQAGDDVDICWRLQQRGLKIGFSPSGFVWHYRRSNVQAYFQQQRGYGEAEALLVRKHPEYFNALGGSMWRGRIYGSARAGLRLRRPIIYHGLFGTGFFQTLYAGESALSLLVCTALEYHVLLTLPLLALATAFPFLLPLALVSLALSVAAAALAGAQAALPQERRRWWSRPLVAALFLLQPIVRGWARYRGRLVQMPLPERARAYLADLPAGRERERGARLYFLSENDLSRVEFLRRFIGVLEQQGWPFRADAGWSDHDVEVHGNRWSRLQLLTAIEYYAGGKAMICCRLRTAWSLSARVVFLTLLAVELILMGLLATRHPWIWGLLLSLAPLGWFIEQQKRDLCALVVALANQTARNMKLARLRYNESEDRFEPWQ